MPSTDEAGDRSKANVVPDDDSDLSAFAPPPRSEDRERSDADRHSDLAAFALPGSRRSDGPSELREIVARNPVATSLVALGLGLIIGRLAR